MKTFYFNGKKPDPTFYQLMVANIRKTLFETQQHICPICNTQFELAKAILDFRDKHVCGIICRNCHFTRALVLQREGKYNPKQLSIPKEKILAYQETRKPIGPETIQLVLTNLAALL